MKCQKCEKPDFPGFDHFMLVKDIRTGEIVKLCWACVTEMSTAPKKGEIWHELPTEFEFWGQSDEN